MKRKIAERSAAPSRAGAERAFGSLARFSSAQSLRGGRARVAQQPLSSTSTVARVLFVLCDQCTWELFRTRRTKCRGRTGILFRATDDHDDLTNVRHTHTYVKLVNATHRLISPASFIATGGLRRKKQVVRSPSSTLGRFFWSDEIA